MIVNCFNRAVTEDNLILRCFGYLNLLDHLGYSPSTKVKIDGYLLMMIQSALTSTSNGSMRTIFGVGAGLKAYVSSTGPHHEQAVNLWLQLRSGACHHGTIIPYLETLLEILKKVPSDSVGEEVRQVVDVVVKNLHSASHSLRKTSLELLKVLYEKLHHRPADILSAAWEVEICPLDHSYSRAMSMYIRKLSSSYQTISTHEWLPKAIVHFCFGVLSYKLASAKKDAITTLKQICENESGEALVSDLCFKWLEQCNEKRADAVQEQVSQEQGQDLTSFQCSNLMKVETTISEGSRQVTEAEEILRQRFNAVHERHDQQTVNAPTLALQVLAAVPHVAEKRSRRLVPMFLSWAREEQASTVETAEEEDVVPQISDNDNVFAQVWASKDRRAMLDLFGSFHNPSVLYQSSQVFDALQEMLMNGNIEIQKSALKAIFTWKLKEIQPYQEQLSNLLDDKLFRDELSTFLQVDEQDSVIESDHRRALMSILLRLLYGRIIARNGTKSGSSGQPAKRKAVIQALSRLDDEYLRLFVGTIHWNGSIDCMIIR